jgi:CRISPR type I-E-associated protein CasB/Cse2
MVATEAKDNIDWARAFIEHLQLRSEPIDLMRLRRLLNRAEYSATIPLVEEYLDSAGCKDPWERQAHALVAKLWAKMVLERREDQAGKATQPGEADDRRSLGHAAAKFYLARDRNLDIEHKLLDLLEAEAQQVGHRLNLLIMTLEYEPGIPIHWPELLADLLVWNHQDRPTQKKWARDFNSLLKERGLHSQEAKTDRQGGHKYKPTSVQTPFWSRWDLRSFLTYLLAFAVGLTWGLVLMDVLRNANAG